MRLKSQTNGPTDVGPLYLLELDTMNAALPSTGSKFIEATSPHVMNTYGRVPIALSHGQGCRVWDINGKSYLDALGGR